MLPPINSAKPSNLILYPRLFAISISSLSIFFIPSTWILLFKKELKHNDDNIFNFADTSLPFKAADGLDSA